MSAPALDPSVVVDATLDAVTSGVQDNLGPIGLVAGGLVAIGIVVRLARKHIKPS